MSIGLIGRKRGMTRVFTEAGASVPVTVIEVDSNRVSQIKNQTSDGYSAVQITSGKRKPARVNKAEAGHFRKAGVEPGSGLWEFRLANDDSLTIKHGDSREESGGEQQEIEIAPGVELPVSIFSSGQHVDVVGRSIGKGYGGVIKRHNFSAQRTTHGNAKKHRAPGSIGQNQSPGHVFKGKKMSGHLGDARETVHNLEVVRVDEERNLLLVRGGVPGSKGADVVIKPAIKKAG